MFPGGLIVYDMIMIDKAGNIMCARRERTRQMKEELARMKDLIREA